MNEELRDKIATAAMQAMLTDDEYRDSPPMELALEAYAMADLMLIAREQRDWTVGGDQ